MHSVDFHSGALAAQRTIKRAATVPGIVYGGTWLKAGAADGTARPACTARRLCGIGGVGLSVLSLSDGAVSVQVRCSHNIYVP